ncbi:hypothetical protein BJ170DRAFT_218384 [Xylariales sp. AK1849]|nr:hypothetical protein BJ170DRAFT_218384 [Xylariales sp. AK1849]
MGMVMFDWNEGSWCGLELRIAMCAGIDDLGVAWDQKSWCPGTSNLGPRTGITCAYLPPNSSVPSPVSPLASVPGSFDPIISVMDWTGSSFSQIRLKYKYIQRHARSNNGAFPVPPNFPCPCNEFAMCSTSQRPGGLTMYTSLLQTHYTGDWAKVDVVACCEVGGFVYVS